MSCYPYLSRLERNELRIFQETITFAFESDEKVEEIFGGLFRSSTFVEFFADELADLMRFNVIPDSITS